VILLLQENPTVKIQIEGHTDIVGNAVDNLKLSENRAKAVVTYFISKGIDPKRLSSKGFGATKPISGNNSEEERAQNRRTELKIISL
jgi:outer membrane protein OmpA-like peptidoglycan-associated protein